MEKSKHKKVNTPDSPIVHLLKPFAGSPYSIAPERKHQLLEIQKGIGISIRLDCTRSEFFVCVSRLLRRIDFGFPALERLWAYAYCYSVLFDLIQKSEMGTLIDLTKDAHLNKARLLLVWANDAETKQIHTPWPKDLPSPVVKSNEDPHVLFAHQMFLAMSGFILLHEMAHLILSHETSMDLSPEQSIRQEYEADCWAANWIMSKWQEFSRDELVFIKRSLGIAFALATLGGIEIYADKPHKPTHPSSPERLLAFLDHHLPQPPDRVLPAKYAAWRVPIAVYQVHLMKLGKHYDPTMTFPSYRDYLIGIAKRF